jgi:hypothetical protein
VAREDSYRAESEKGPYMKEDLAILEERDK